MAGKSQVFQCLKRVLIEDTWICLSKNQIQILTNKLNIHQSAANLLELPNIVSTFFLHNRRSRLCLMSLVILSRSLATTRDNRIAFSIFSHNSVWPEITRARVKAICSHVHACSRWQSTKLDNPVATEPLCPDGLSLKSTSYSCPLLFGDEIALISRCVNRA